MISYAQNHEDVVLRRLLQFVDIGTFVDVGAGHPVLENVTYDLYLNGWRGVNIEPMAREAQLLREIRPLDRTVQAAAGATPGQLTLYAAPPENRGATTHDRSLAESYGAEGQEFSAFTCEKVRIDTLLAELRIDEIHLLKIDVEGYERAVLEGANLDKTRPWVLIIEATRPNSTVDASHEWESMVLSCGYVLTLFDGLNKFFVRSDLRDVSKALSAPANVFDNWKSAETVRLLQIENEYVPSLEQQVIDLEERARRAEEYAASLETELQKVSDWKPNR